jgi:hypothetical protein
MTMPLYTHTALFMSPCLEGGMVSGGIAQVFDG